MDKMVNDPVQISTRGGRTCDSALESRLRAEEELRERDMHLAE